MPGAEKADAWREKKRSNDSLVSLAFLREFKITTTAIPILTQMSK